MVFGGVRREVLLPREPEELPSYLFGFCIDMKNLSGGRLEDKWEVMEGVKFLRYLDVAFWLRFYQWCYFNMGVLLFSHEGTK